MKKTLFLLVVSPLLALTACGGGSKSSPAAGPPSGPPSVSTVGGTSTGSASVDVCSALPVADVARITGTHFTTSKSSSVAGQVFDCEYTDASFDLLQVSVTVANGSLAYDSQTQAMSAVEKPIPVSGVGDKAFTVADPKGNAGSAGVAAFASYGALFGDQFVKIGGSYVTPDQGRQIVEEIHGRL